MQWNHRLNIWDGDEWLVDIYDDQWLARQIVEDWGAGRPWDNNREVQITKYFRKRKSLFEPGNEISGDHPALCEKVWLRYSEFELHERSDVKW